MSNNYKLDQQRALELEKRGKDIDINTIKPSRRVKINGYILAGIIFVKMLFLYISGIMIIENKLTQSTKFLLYVMLILGIWKLKDFLNKVQAYTKDYMLVGHSLGRSIALALAYMFNTDKDGSINSKDIRSIDFTERDYELNKKEYEKFCRFKKMYDKIGER